MVNHNNLEVVLREQYKQQQMRGKLIYTVWTHSLQGDNQGTSVERMDVSGVARDLLMTVDLKDDQMVQTKCFTNWANSYLAKRNPPVTIFNLFEEMKDGINLLYLLEVLSGEELVPDKETGTGVQAVRKGRDMTLSDKVTNAKASLAYLEDNGVKIPAGVTPQEITNGTPPKILDLMWAIVSHYQIEEVAKMSRRTVSGLNASMAEDSMYGTMPRTSSQSTTPTKGGKFGFSGSSSSLPSLGKRKKGRDQSPGPTRKKSGKETKEAQKILLKWAQNAVDRRVVDVKDFSKSWRNGKAFSSLVHTIQPDLVDMPRLSTKSASSRMEHAFTAAERFLGIPKLIDSEDMDVERPDGRSVMTYVSLYAQAFPQAGGWTAPTPSQRDVRYLGLGSGNTSSFRRAGSARGAYNSTSSGGGQYISGVGAGEVPSVSVTEFQSVKTTEVTTYEQNTQLSSYEQNAQLVTEDSYRTSDVTSDSLYDDVMNEVGAGGTFSGQRFTGVMNGAAQDMHGDVAGDLTQSATTGHAMAVKGGAYEYGQQTSQQTAKGGVGVDYGQQSYRQQTSDHMFTFDSGRGPGQSQSTSVRSSALMEDGSSPTVVMANKGDMSPIRVSINLPSYAGRRSAKGSTGGGEGPGKDEYSRGLGNIRGWLADVDKEYPKDIIVYHQDVQEHIEDLETLDTEAGKHEDKLQVLSRQVGSMSGDEAAAARSDLNDVQEEITRIRNDVSKEKNNCTRMLPYVKRFEDDTAEIDNWLSDAEKLMMSHMVDSTSAKFNQRVQNHKEFFTTRNVMRNKLSSCNSDLKKIEGLCLDNHDKTPLQTRFEDIDSRFEDGMALSLTWDDKLDDIQENWRDFDKRTDDVGSWLDKANDIMTDRDQPLDIQIARHETFFKDVDSDMMEGLVQSGERLAEDMNDPEKEQLQDQMGKIENKWKDVMYQAPIALMKLKFRKSQDLYDETINKMEKESNRELELLANPSVDREDLWNTHEGLYHREPEGFLPTAERHVSDMENYSKELVQYSVDEMSLVGPAKDHRQHFENVKREERVLCDKLKNARQPQRYGALDRGAKYGAAPSRLSYQYPRGYRRPDKGYRYGGVPFHRSKQYPVEGEKQGKGGGDADAESSASDTPSDQLPKEEKQGKVEPKVVSVTDDSERSDTVPANDQQPIPEEKQEKVEAVATESSASVPPSNQTPVEQKDQETAEDTESSAAVPASDQQPAGEEEKQETVEAEADSITDNQQTKEAVRPDKGAGYHGAPSGDSTQQLPDTTDSGGGGANGASDATIFATVIPKVQPHAMNQDRWRGDSYPTHKVSGGGQGQISDRNGSGGGQQINIHEGKGGGLGSWKTRPEEIERAHRWKQFFEKKEAMLQECTNIDDTLDGEEQWEITPNNVRERDRLFERLERDLQHNRGETPELKTMGSWLEREMPHKKEDIVGDIAYVERTQDETEEHLRRARQEHEDLLTRINEFYECKERTHKCIDRAELVLRSRICQRPADIASQLDKHENAESELSNNMPKLDLMSKRGTELVQDLRSSNLWKTTEIRKEMDHTSHRWIEVSEQLHDNKDVLRNMENIWDEMYNINSDFEDWFNGPVEDLRKRLYTISDASEVPDMQRRLDLFQDEIIDRENQWTKLNNRAKRLQELNQNVPISLVERMVQRNKDGIEEAKKLAVEGRRKLDSFKANQDFGRRNLDPLQKWLDKEERLLSAQYDLQMDIYSKKAQRDKFESFSNEIASHRWKFDEVNSKAREVNLSQNPEIVRQLEQINARYSALKIECDNITKKCEGHVTDHAQYDELYEEASEWLRQQREKLKEAQRPTTDWKELEENHANINLLLLTKKRGEIKINNTSEKADVTMDNTSADGKPIIIEQVESLRHDFQLYQEELNAAKLKVEGQLEGMKPEINRSKLDASLAIEQRLDQNLSQQTISTYQYTESSKTVYGSQTIGGTGGTYGGTAQGTGGGYGGIGQGTGSGYGGIGQGTGTGYGGIGQGTGSGYGGIGQSSSGGYISQTTSTSGAGGSAGGLGGGSSINQFLGGGSGHGVFDIAVSSVKKSTVTKEVGVQPSPSRQRTSTSTETMTDDLRKKVGDKVFQEIVLQPGERRTFGSGDNVVHYHNSQSEPITVKINYLVNYWE
ncbi:uncharacterized protein LOC144912725 isoform X44 [Branchiostoma floridae x Branchiostoma belcheri]